jgi:acetolactate synthase-1/3 small subunit
MSSKSLAHTFIVDVEDRPGTLNRVVSLFRRRNYNIDSLSVGRTERPGVSRITLRARADDDVAQRIEANLYKLVNVLKVQDLTHAPSVVRELAFIKVRVSHDRRCEVLRLCDLFRARVVDLHSSALTVEITGTEDKVHRLIEVLRPFGILESLRTGAVAMVRGSLSEESSDEVAA